MLIGKNLIRGAAWNLFGALASRIIQLFGTIVIARKLSPDAFGKVGEIQATILMMISFGDLGLSSTANRLSAHINDNINDQLINIKHIQYLLLITSAIVCLPVLIFHTKFELLLFHSGGNWYYWVAIIPIIFTALQTQLFNAIFQGSRLFKLVSTINIITSVIQVLIQVSATLFFGFTGFLFGTMISGVMTFISWAVAINLCQYPIWINKLNYYSIKLSFKKLRELLIQSIPVGFSNILVFPTIWICTTMLAVSRNGYFEMGVYNASNQIRTLLLFVAQNIATSQAPLLVAKLSTSINPRKDLFSSYYSSSLLIFLGIAIPSLVLFPLSASILEKFNVSFPSHKVVLQITLISTIIQGQNTLLTYFLIILNRGKEILFGLLIFSILSIYFTKILMSYGSTGLVLAQLISNAFIFIYLFIILLKKKGE